MPLAPGTRLGPYEILAPLGAGGMGEVYQAHDARLGRDVAIKVLPHEAVGDETARRRLLREARLAAQLNHPNICTVYDVGEAEGRVFIAMERVEGGPLDRLIGSGGLPTETVVRYAVQIADALDCAHRSGVIHRDLKCANILVGPDGRVKVLDFGLAKRAADDRDGVSAVTVTQSGEIAGTLHCLAPEILRGAAADVRNDVWSFGVVLYEMASGARPFRGATAVALGAAILNESPEPLPPRVPAGLATIVGRCLAKDPAQRYQHAAEVRSALGALEPGGASALAATRRPRARVWVVTVTLIAVAALALAIETGTHWFHPGPKPLTSVAVLPLDNLSRDPEQQYFADGMTDELITTLAQFSRLRVISRTSVMAFKGAKGSLREIARKLGVDAIVEGSVQRSGNRVRITAQLIRGATDEHMWAHTYERDVRDVLALQDEVAAAIAAAVQGRLADELAGPRLLQQGPGLAGPQTVSPRAYDLYLRGLSAYRRWEKPGEQAALEFLTQALQEDSTYAPAWAVLGLVYLDDPGQFGTRAEDVAHARRAVERALALDPRLGLAHSAKAQIEFDADWNWAGAESEFRRAIELTPNSFEAHHVYAHLLMSMGRARESLEQSRVALALDPLNTAAVLHMGWYYYFAGQYDQAIRQFEATLHLDPSFSEAYRFLSATYALEGRYGEADAAQQKALELTGASDTTSTTVQLRSRLAMGAVIAARSGHTQEARTMASRMIDGVGRGQQSAYDVATIFALLGRKDDAFHWLDRAITAREEYVVSLRCDPFLASLRTDPRFALLLRRMGLPA